MSEDQIQSLSLRLTQQLFKLLSSFPDLSQEIGGAYLPLKDEIAPVYQELLKIFPAALAFPVLSDGQMLFGLPSGIPKGMTWLDQPYQLVKPTWFLVPGVGFDLGGVRLGRGRGYYDRYFESHEGLKIGLAWSEQIREKIPVESHDSHMDFIITENYCWDVNQQLKF